jgi:hypothetical protein
VHQVLFVSPYIWNCVVEMLPDSLMGNMGVVIECGVCGDAVDDVFCGECGCSEPLSLWSFLPPLVYPIGGSYWSH